LAGRALVLPVLGVVTGDDGTRGGEQGCKSASDKTVDLIHLFTSGPQEAIIQVAVKPDTPQGEALRGKLCSSLRGALPECQISFEAVDIVTQVMSFGSPTPVEVAVPVSACRMITSSRRRLAQKWRSCPSCPISNLHKPRTFSPSISTLIATVRASSV
jgi:hypothetical protein